MKLTSVTRNPKMGHYTKGRASGKVVIEDFGLQYIRLS
jgi:hypothetical protein